MMLTRKVAWPTDRPMLMAIPSARTVHGVLPIPAAIRMASPVPKTQRPMIRMTRLCRRGLVVIGSSALHHVVGTSFAGRKKEGKPIAHDEASALNPIGVLGCAAGLPSHYLRGIVRVVG